MLLVRFVSGSQWQLYSAVPTKLNAPISDHHDAEEELCVVKFVFCVSFADRIRIGEGVQVSKQVEPRREVFGRPCRLCETS